MKHKHNTRLTAHARGYTGRWQKARLSFLAAHPLCAFCSKDNQVTAATVVDHITPHKGDQKLFWDKNNWQSLCKSCHDSTKQRQENGTLRTIGLDGWPVTEGDAL